MRPSALVGVDDTYRAWCFDEACSTWGNAIMGALQDVKGDNEALIEIQRQFILEAYLGIEGEYATMR